jgi:HK97 family phage portal protein
MLSSSKVVETNKSIEGQYRPGPYPLTVSGGWLSAQAGQYWNWWQMGYDPINMGSSSSSIVEACVSAYAQTTAMCPGDHWWGTDDGGRERLTTTALSRILRYPNEYQSISDFMLNLTRNLYLEGNAYALCVRNSRYEISEMHIMQSRSCAAYVAEDGEIFYSLGGNPIVDRKFGFLGLVPQRDVLHVKLHTPRNLLLGESPLMAAAMDILAGSVVKQQQLQFYMNQARPGIVLSTDLLLDKDQVQALRDRWNEQTTGDNTGGTPILTGGLKPVAIPVMTSRDAQLADIMKMSKEDIALAFRVPLQMLGLGRGAPMHSTEALMQAWVSSGLGFCLNHIEEAFGVTFQLKGPPNEYVEFSTAALLRSAFKDRISALKDGVLGGIYSPNEARNSEDLPSVEYGDEPRVQQQVVPLSAAASIPRVPQGASTTPIPASPAAPPAPPSGASPQGALTDAPKQLARVFFDRANKLKRSGIAA